MAFKQEEIKPYGGADGKGEEVERMFDNIAPTYDKLNHRLSWDIDKWWRKKAIRHLAAFKPRRILDVATGTGDFAIQAAHSLDPESVIGVDISEGMMEIGRQKASEEGLDDVIRFQKEDCMDLGFPKETFDAVIAAFGIRNFQDLERGLREIYRVLKNGVTGAHHARKFPLATTFQALFPQRTALIRQNDIGRQGRLFLPHEDHRRFPAGRNHDGRVAQDWLHGSRFPAPYIWHMHHVLRN